MKVIRAISFDPALANFGMARIYVFLDTLEIQVEGLKLVSTEKRTNKVVRQNSDDLRRAQELHRAMAENCGDCAVAFAEIPTGAQSARAMYAFGVAVGLLASCPIPLIQVQPFETKLATVGTKTASKEEMIEWAAEAHPTAPWKRYEKDLMFKGVARRKAGDICDDQEHLADALAIAHAGVRTDQFRQLVAMWRSAYTPPRIPAVA